MPPPNTRKRPAPGSVPTVQPPPMQPTFSAPNQITNDQLLQWGQGPGADATGYADPNAYSMNNVAPGMPGVQYQPTVPPTSTQLARRPMTRQLVTAPRNAFDNPIDPWGQFGEESLLDTQNMNGLMEESDNIELLEERAAAAKRDAQSKRKQIPPFVQKLSSFLDESKNTDLIRWSDKGDSFIVLDEDEFAKTLIPELFKHNNYASFVRQLNMYGFHKRVGLSDNSMKASERKNKSPSEYYNPYFKRGYPNLLWLINKPKGGSSQKKSKGTKIKNEEGEVESEDENKEGVDESYGHQGYNNSIQSVPRAISAAPEAGPLQRREIAIVQSQLAEIQKQQSAISNAISRLRKDHNQLYQQAVAFQTLHDRHESSINAILTFLATVYNRSLDGQGPQNIAQMFANVIPQDQQHHQHHQHSQGNVVDIGDVSNQQHAVPGSPGPHRRQRLLLGPAPSSDGRATTLSPADTTQTSQYTNPKSSTVEELFDPPTDKTQIKMELDQRPQQTMMNIINNNNARRPGAANGIEFPEMLSRYEHANGKGPLTSEQRNNMLNLIANSTSTPGSNNALVSPTPPQHPNLEDLAYTQAELDELIRLQQAQDESISKVQDMIIPLSPSGQIPGLTDSVHSYFPDGNTPSPGANIDLDQFLDSGAYYNNTDPNDFNYSNFTDGNVGQVDSKFDLHSNGIADEVAGRITDATASSKGTTPTPEPSIEEASSTSASGRATPVKRRRKA
ncbi:hypothetical protein F5884DRAFT_57908 [Xylogone sp. PMI_703]|nr:hypothetical protein F5884DRAFT_57908 [Xylogone sp. PMI_703]